MAVIKRDKQTSSGDLVNAIERLIPLLHNQDEEDAAQCLNEAAAALKTASPGVPLHRKAIEQIIEAFEGEHELMAYTFQRQGNDNEWTEADELSQASSRVLTLARRMKA
jgi:hypothetical protein